MILNYFLLLLPAIVGIASFLIFWFILPPKSSIVFFIVAMLWAGSFMTNSLASWFLDPFFQIVIKTLVVALSAFLGPLFMHYHQTLFEGTTRFKLKPKAHFIFPGIVSLLSLSLLLLNLLVQNSDLINNLNNYQELLILVIPIHTAIYLVWVKMHQNEHKQFYRKFYTELERLNENLTSRISLSITWILAFKYAAILTYSLNLGWLILLNTMLGIAIVSTFLMVRMIAAIRKQQEILDSRKAKMKTHHQELGILPVGEFQ